jgi:hypothetical protein
MGRSLTVALGALLVVAVGAFVWRTSTNAPPAAAHDAGVEAGITVPPVAVLDAGFLEDPLLLGLLEGTEGGVPSAPSAGAALPANAPKLVRFGVILVQYRGAQGAGQGARSRDEAAALARTLAEAAKTDFKAQVVKGDPGSLDDAGRIPRGVLEPGAELVLFTLEKGAVSEPLDTPRGFWIVKRLE